MKASSLFELESSSFCLCFWMSHDNNQVLQPMVMNSGINVLLFKIVCFFVVFANNFYHLTKLRA